VKPIGEARLTYYNTGLGSRRPAATHLAWEVHLRGVTASEGIGTTWTYFVDAHDGQLLRGIDDSPRAFHLSIKNGDHTDGESDECLASRDDLQEWFTEAGPTEEYPARTRRRGGSHRGACHIRLLRHPSGMGFVQWARRYDTGYRAPGARLDTSALEDRLQRTAFRRRHGRHRRVRPRIHSRRSAIQPDARFDLDLDETFSVSESYSDFFGCLVESGDAAAIDWTLGEDTVFGAAADLSDPPRVTSSTTMMITRMTMSGSMRNTTRESQQSRVLITDGGTHTTSPSPDSPS